jgi:hypothetical protein
VPEVSPGCGADEQINNVALSSIGRRRKSMNTNFLGVPWFVWGLLSLVIAVIFTVIWPGGRSPSTLLQYIILRWFHALVWVLLAVSFFLRGGMVLGGSGTANLLALLALLVYIIFMGTVLTSSR